MTNENSEGTGRLEATIKSINQQRDDVAGSIQEAVDGARQSVHDVQYELNETADGAEVIISGKLSDIKSFEKELERQISGHDVSISVDIDYDVDGNVEIDFS